MKLVGEYLISSAGPMYWIIDFVSWIATNPPLMFGWGTWLSTEPKDQGRVSRLLKQTAVLKLNGGLGTSMGLEKAKSLLVVKDDMTFLDLIAQQVSKYTGCNCVCKQLLCSCFSSLCVLFRLLLLTIKAECAQRSCEAHTSCCQNRVCVAYWELGIYRQTNVDQFGRPRHNELAHTHTPRHQSWISEY